VTTSFKDIQLTGTFQIIRSEIQLRQIARILHSAISKQQSGLKIASVITFDVVGHMANHGNRLGSSTWDRAPKGWSRA
jgi:hypothetical protein